MPFASPYPEVEIPGSAVNSQISRGAPGSGSAALPTSGVRLE
jgi:hypothetical protein